MNAKRLTLALIVALLISGLFTFWLSRRVAKAAHVAAPQKRFYVAAGKTLEAGELLKPGSLHLVEWPASLTGGFTKIDDVAGRNSALSAGEGPTYPRSVSCPCGSRRRPGGKYSIGHASDFRPLR